MAGDKDQKTAILSEMPPDVAAAINRGQQGGQQQRTMAVGAPAPAPGGDAGGSPRTVMLDAHAQAPRSAPVPESMRNRPEGGALPPMARPPSQSTWIRWVVGPVISIVVAIGTAALARVVMPQKSIAPPAVPKKMGKLRLTTDPAGASITVDGRAYPRFTPTTYEGVVGTNPHIVFKFDGFDDYELDAEIKDETEKPLAVKMVKTVEKAPEPTPVAKPEKPEKKPHEHTPKPPKETGTGTISIRARPWAIVYVDGARLKQTPILDYSLSAGKHTIELLNEPKGKRQKHVVVIKAGANPEINEDFSK
jgi:hypothetical protein